ncbi:MAG: ribosome recycling factor [Leptospiraceae bacterium]|jgi:ribosome recycling factor|nr:ribosome recycling factor [Leptospiraceae bacterium]MCZ8239151.1 ribosome recycling factor [Leptospiraceae bacterium]MCZ8347644.1 ribosome recycling factor [Leptospiraceae bacterium]
MSDEIIQQMTSKMDKTIEALKKDFSQVRSGKANPAMIEDVKAEYYGTPTALNQLGNITAPEPRMLVFSPYDKGAIKEVERAIQSSGLGLTPTNDGVVIRIILPELTGERRKELAKVVKTKSEEKKVAIRNIRRDANDDLKKDSEGKSQDEMKVVQDKIQKTTDSYIAKIDELAKDKEKEILTV